MSGRRSSDPFPAPGFSAVDAAGARAAPLAFVEGLPAPAPSFRGAGVVIAAGGLAQLITFVAGGVIDAGARPCAGRPGMT